MSAAGDSLRSIPQVDALLRETQLEDLRGRLSHAVLVGLAREVLAEAREELRRDPRAAAQLSPAELAARMRARAAQWLRPPLCRVINATGILIHTNLGRAPLSSAAQAAVAQVCGGYANLEMDLATGRRISRLDRVRELLRRVTGAEDALAVNNNAAAVFLALHGIAAGREVVVSRGELVEIGGSFRLPDIMAASGAELREVGTTNRTHLDDYTAALGERSAMILKVHPSNFVVQGFSAEVEVAALARAAHERSLPLFVDLGSGALEQHPREFLRGEPRVQEVLRAGADLVAISGDKLLGGPQSGILLGRGELVGRLKRLPVARVLRLDKLHLAALEATLLDYLCGAQGVERIPLYRMMRRSVEDLRGLGEEICALVRPGVGAQWRLQVVATQAAAGGGALPGETLPSAAIEIACPDQSVDELARHLRLQDPAIVGRIERERLLLDLRSLAEEDWGLVPGLLVAGLNGFRHSAASQGG